MLGAAALCVLLGQAISLEALVRDYLGSEETVRTRAEGALREDVRWTRASRETFQELETLLARGPDSFPALPEGEAVHALTVPFPDGRTMPVFILPPPKYDSARPWPMLLAMHGGPTGSAAQAVGGAERMLQVWFEPARRAGWFVVSPAMTHVVAMAPRTEDRLPYEILTAPQIEATLRVVSERYHIDPNRIVSTGISLGSNFSIAFAAARPDRLAAIVPVSTEGESREHLLRNLFHVPTFVLEGTRDRNIRGIGGPRALEAILNDFEYDLVYREMRDRAHEGFQEFYPEVLQWLEARPRNPFPKEVIRVPHAGIMPLAKRVHWIEADTRQAVVRAKAAGQRIDIEVSRARELEVYLHDALVDLDRRVEIWVNGVQAHSEKLNRSVPFALEQVRQLQDRSRPYATSLTITVPDTREANAVGEALSGSLAPKHPEGTLSFWETYAVRALEERFPGLGIEGASEDGVVRITGVDPGSPFERAGVEVGDKLVEIGGEPFYDDRGLTAHYQWILRELDGVARPYTIVVLRDGVRREFTATLKLGPYRE